MKKQPQFSAACTNANQLRVNDTFMFADTKLVRVLGFSKYTILIDVRVGGCNRIAALDFEYWLQAGDIKMLPAA